MPLHLAGNAISIAEYAHVAQLVEFVPSDCTKAEAVHNHGHIHDYDYALAKNLSALNHLPFLLAILVKNPAEVPLWPS